MAYQIDRYNNTLLTIVEDGTIDQTTDLKFIGKNYAGYGEIQNENFLYLLENFSGANQPPRPLSGQVWFDSGTSKMRFYDGVQWRTIGGAEVSETEPTGLAIGDLWWDSVNEQLYALGASGWVLIGPQNAGEGITQMQSLEVRDNADATHIIIAATIEDSIIFIISPDEFDLSTTHALSVSVRSQGFDRIKKGTTLKWTKAADNGVTNSAGEAGKDFYYWGTASNADKLGGISAANYLTSSSPSFSSAVEFPDAGILIGDDQDLHIKIEDGDDAVIQNVTGTNSIIKLKATNGAGAITHALTIDATGIKAASDNAFDIGASGTAFRDMYAYSFVGEATKAATLRVGTDFRSASVSASNNTVAVRDATGNLAANLFQGTATQARYADLAEKYTTDEEYPVGTVMAVCEHGEHETESAGVGSHAIGVISDKPAYLMNSEAEGQAIALKGRVPVRVNGAVNKGDAVYVDADGCASTTINGGSIVGIALEASDKPEEKLIECVLKV